MSVRFAYRVLSLVVLISLAIQPLAVMGRQVDEETSRQGIAAPAASGLYRTTVTVDSPARRARLDALGVVVLREPDPSGFRKPEGSTAVVLADAEQLEALACLRFEPAGSDDLAALTAAAGPEQAWLAASLRPLLAQIGRAHV